MEETKIVETISEEAKTTGLEVMDVVAEEAEEYVPEEAGNGKLLAGLVVGGVALVAGAVYWMKRHKKKAEAEKAENTGTDDDFEVEDYVDGEEEDVVVVAEEKELPVEVTEEKKSKK